MKNTKLILNASIHKQVLLAFICFSFLAFTVFAKIGFALYVFFLVCALVTLKKTQLVKDDFFPIVSFYILPFLYLFVTAIHSFALDTGFIQFSATVYGRLLNYALYLSLYIVIMSAFNRELLNMRDVIKAYKMGLCILVFFGIWQLCNMIFHIPYPNFATRSAIHSMDAGTLGKSFQFRITSLAREPAYLIPYLMDLFIIEFYTRKSFALLSTISILIFFTLSVSGYCNFLFIVMAIILLGNKRSYKIFAFLCASLIVFFLIFYYGNVIFSVLGRLNPKHFQSTRIQEAYLPFEYMSKNMDIFTFLFGYGPKGLQYVSSFLHYTGFFSGMPFPVTATTHVIFVDFFIDYGFIGLSIMITFFIFLCKTAKKVFLLKKTRIMEVLLLNLCINCVYTADYASPRFTVLIILFLCFYKDVRYKSEVVINETH